MTAAPLRVAHVVCTDAFAGVERQVAAVATGLAERGVEVTVIGGAPGPMREIFGAAVSWRPGHHPSMAARSLRAVAGPAVVHAHMTAAEAVAAVAGRRLGPLVVTRHFADPRGRSIPGRLVRPLIQRRLSRQLAVSHFVAAAIASPCEVLPNGVPATDAIGHKREPTVVLLQRLEPEKDTATALRAWHRAGLAAAGWRLVIYGRGSEQDRLQRLAADLHLTGSVTFAGFTDAPAVVLGRCGFLLATATAEPFGLSVVEAMATATPVVATAAGAHRETLGADGHFFGPGDVAGCARTLRELAFDPAERSRAGTALRRRQRERFTLDQHLDRLINVYEQVMAEHGSRRG